MLKVVGAAVVYGLALYGLGKFLKEMEIASPVRQKRPEPAGD